MPKSRRCMIIMKYSLPVIVAGLVLFAPTSFSTAEEPAPTSKAEASPAKADSDDDPSLLQRGHELLAQKRYDDAIKKFKAALKKRATAEAHIGLATAMLRGRRVLQPGDLCDPVFFREELRPHIEESEENAGCPRTSSYFTLEVIRCREIVRAGRHLEEAARLAPERLSIHEQIASVEIARSQFLEEATLRSCSRGEVDYATESLYGWMHRRDRFELPSLMLGVGGTYPMDVNQSE